MKKASLMILVLVLVFLAVVVFYLMNRGVGQIPFQNFISRSPEATPPVQNYPDLSSANFLVEIDDHPTLGNILIDNDGRTLYTYKDEAAGVLHDPKIWVMAMKVMENEEITAPAGILSDLSKVKTVEGDYALTYKNKLLYYYAGDVAPGDTAGNGVDNIWSVIQVENPY